MQNIPCVLQPAKLGSITLRNKLVVPPMVTLFGDEKGFVTDDLVNYARARAAGGFGLFILEATYVDPIGKGFPRGIGIDTDDKIPGLKGLVNAIHAEGGHASVQLHHAGRETTSAITGQTIVAPSACPVCYSDEQVHELTREEINGIVKRFAAGARRAKEAGFDAVMIHGAHGYLLTQFLSPYTNKRTDEYGGSLENRLRISLEIIDAIREEVGEDFPVTYRMTVDEGIPGGLILQESSEAAKILSKAPIDALHIVAGNYATNHLILPPAAYGDLTNRSRLRAIREAVGPDFPLAVAGRITNVFQAEELFQQGLADFVAMGRASLADPELPKRSLAGKYTTVRSCIGCNDGCIGRTSKGEPVNCALNSLTGHEVETKKFSAFAPVKKVMVIGGGPAGMEAAWLAAKQGHNVMLCEKTNRLGGQFLLAAYPPHKDDIFTYINNMGNRLKEEGVDVRMECEVGAELLQKEKPDAVILATGGNPLRIPFPGLDTIQNSAAQEILQGGVDKLGQRVAVIGGGMVGCETAEFIASTGRNVEIVEMLPSIAGDLFYTVKDALLNRLAKLNVAIHSGQKVTRIGNGRIMCMDANDNESSFGPFDSVVLALGVKPEASLEEILRRQGFEYVKIGDCDRQGNCRHATQMALLALDI